MFTSQREKMIGRYVYAARAESAVENRAAKCHASPADTAGRITVAGRV